MRNKFADKIFELGKKNKNIYLVAADISPAGSIEKFRKKYPSRFINVGVAEQSMIGICAGLAMQKKIAFGYTIAAFALYRPFEMIRDDLCIQNLPVTIVGMGAGTIYNNLGATHMSQEDISIAKSIPNMKIIAPADPIELGMAVNYCAKNKKGPIYLRIGKSGEKNLINYTKKKWNFGKILKVFSGNDIAVISYGPILEKAINIKNRLFKERQVSISIYNCHTLKPIDKTGINKIIKKYKYIFILEDHSCINGLYSDIIELAYKIRAKTKIISYSLKDEFIKSYGDRDIFLQKHGIDENKIYREIKKLI